MMEHYYVVKRISYDNICKNPFFFCDTTWHNFLWCCSYHRV